MKTTPSERIERYRKKRAMPKPKMRVIRETVFAMTPPDEPFGRSDTLDIYPDGRYNLNGSWVLKSELPAWAHKYLRP